MRGSQERRPVLVAVANLDHVEQLVRTGCDLARVVDGHVRIVSVVVKRRGSPFSMFSDETIVERFARDTQEILDAATEVAPPDVPIEREVLVDHSVAGGRRSAITATGARALVVGWHGHQTRTEAILGTNLDRLITHAPCDLFVERIGYEANGVDSIMVLVAGGPHVRPAAVAEKAIAARNEATVYILSVVRSNGDVDAAREDIATAERLVEDAPGPDVPIESSHRVGNDVPAVIAETATDHDVLIVGVTRRSAVRRRIVGSIPQAVLPRTDRTLLLARSVDVVGRPRFGPLKRLQRES